MPSKYTQPQPATYNNTSLAIRSLFGYTIPRQSLSFFFQGMTMMLRAGRSVADALLYSSQISDPELKQISLSIESQVRNGGSLCHSLEPYARRFPEIVMPILEVGEVSGKLEESSRRLSETFDQAMGIERKIKFGAYNPWIYMLILTFVRFISLIIISIGDWKNPKPFSNMLHDVVLGAILFGVALVGIYFAFRIVLPQIYRLGLIRTLIDLIKIALPGYGAIFRNLSAARWARSFATLWGAGVNISTALEVSSKSALNSHYERAMRTASLHTREGQSLSKCLGSTQLLPPYLLSVIATCEVIGRMDEGLLKLAEQMENEAYSRSIEVMNRTVLSLQMILLIIAIVYAIGRLVI